MSGGYMQEAERLMVALIHAVDIAKDLAAEDKARAALLAHIERGRVPEGAKPAAWAVSGQDLSDYSVWRNEPDEEQLEILNSQCKDGPIIVRTLFFAAPAAPDHSATVPAEVPMPEAVGTRYDGTKLMAEADVQQYGDAREAAGYAHAIKVIKRVRDSHQTATGECQSDCDFVTAWDSAIDALRGEVK